MYMYDIFRGGAHADGLQRQENTSENKTFDGTTSRRKHEVSQAELHRAR